MKKKAEKKDSLFVKIDDPLNLRKKALESSKEVIECLQNYEALKAIRKEKLKNIMKLKTNMNKVSSLISRLRSKLPKTTINIKEGSKPEVVVKEAPKPTIKPAANTEIDKLQSDLDEIESKLNALS